MSTDFIAYCRLPPLTTDIINGDDLVECQVDVYYENSLYKNINAAIYTSEASSTIDSISPASGTIDGGT